MVEQKSGKGVVLARQRASYDAGTTGLKRPTPPKESKLALLAHEIANAGSWAKLNKAVKEADKKFVLVPREEYERLKSERARRDELEKFKADAAELYEDTCTKSAKIKKENEQLKAELETTNKMLKTTSSALEIEHKELVSERARRDEFREWMVGKKETLKRPLKISDFIAEFERVFGRAGVCGSCGQDKSAKRAPVVLDNNPLSVAAYEDDKCEECGHQKSRTGEKK